MIAQRKTVGDRFRFAGRAAAALEQADAKRVAPEFGIAPGLHALIDDALGEAHVAIFFPATHTAHRFFSPTPRLPSAEPRRMLQPMQRQLCGTPAPRAGIAGGPDRVLSSDVTP